MKNPFKKQRNDYDSYDDAYDNGFYRGEEDEDDGYTLNPEATRRFEDLKFGKDYEIK